MGKKRGMTRVFDEKGRSIVCTVIEAHPNVIIQIKNKEKQIMLLKKRIATVQKNDLVLLNKSNGWLKSFLD